MADDISSIFVCNRPIDYFRTVKLCMIVISLYLGLWVTNYCAVAYHLPVNGSMWVFISFLPALLCIILYVFIIRCAALLKVSYIFALRLFVQL